MDGQLQAPTACLEAIVGRPRIGPWLACLMRALGLPVRSEEAGEVFIGFGAPA